MDWAGGCSCHTKEELKTGVSCSRQGRRLADAHSEVMRVLQEMSDKANAWELDYFDGDVALWQECQRAVRFSIGYGRDKASSRPDPLPPRAASGGLMEGPVLSLRSTKDKLC